MVELYPSTRKPDSFQAESIMTKKKLIRSRKLVLESLETREMLSVSPNGFDPTPEAQELFELINRMRMDPQGEFYRIFDVSSDGKLTAKDDRVAQAIKDYSVSLEDLYNQWSTLTAAAPLAWNAALTDAAEFHSKEMQSAGRQEHQFPDGPSITDRAKAAGFEFYFSTDSDGNSEAIIAENLYAYGLSAENGFSAASFTFAAFVVDWNVPDATHRLNIMDPYFTDVGIYMLYHYNPYNPTPVGDWITTVDFAKSVQSGSESGGHLMGVVYDDLNGSGYYEAQEGLADVSVQIRNIGTDEIFLTSTLTAGGYQMYLPNGTYEVSVIGTNLPVPIYKTITISGSNVKVDFKVQEISDEPPVLDLNGPGDIGRNYRTVYYEGNPGGAVSIVDPQLSIHDSDSNMLYSAEIYFLDRPDGHWEILNVDTTGTMLTASFDSAIGKLSISGTAGISDYEKVLRTLSYSNWKEVVSFEDRTICLNVSDGIHLSETVTTTIRMEPAELPEITVYEATVVEGDSDGQFMQFRVSVSSSPRRELYLYYELNDGTAIDGIDYSTPVETFIQILPGQTEAWITVPIYSNFDSQDDRAFSLWVTDFENATCSTIAVTGTIRDDDRLKSIAGQTGYKETGIDLTDIRRLYSFTPKNDTVVSWEALAANGVQGVKLSLFEGTHASNPIATSIFTGNSQSLKMTLNKGVTYTLMVEGETTLDTLRMVQNIIPDQNEVKFGPQNGQGNAEIRFDDDGIMIDFPGYYPVKYDRGSLFMIWLENSDPDQGLIISGKNPVLDAENGKLVIDDVEIDIAQFNNITLKGTEEFDSITILGTSGDDSFTFENKGGLFEASNGLVLKLENFKTIEIDGNGGNDTAILYDTPHDDTVFFGNAAEIPEGKEFAPGIVTMNGSGYNVKVQDFTTVTVDAIFGGNDLLNINCSNGSSLILHEFLSMRSEQQGDKELLYKTVGFKNVSVTDDDSLNPSNVLILGSRTDRDIIELYPGYTSASNEDKSFSFDVRGYSNIQLSPQDDYAPKVDIYDDKEESVFEPELGTVKYVFEYEGVEYEVVFSELARFDFHYREDPKPENFEPELFTVRDYLFASEILDLEFDFGEYEKDDFSNIENLFEELV